MELVVWILVLWVCLSGCTVKMVHPIDVVIDRGDEYEVVHVYGDGHIEWVRSVSKKDRLQSTDYRERCSQSVRKNL